MIPPTLRFDAAEADRAWDAWKFNCGPAAVCAVTGMTPEELRPHLGDFEKKGFTNPTLMLAIMRSLKVADSWWCWTGNDKPPRWPAFGVARIQWDGPWTKGGVPARAAYRHTHWVGSFIPSGDPDRHMVFDVNAMEVGGWVGLFGWKTKVVPWLLEDVPRASGRWWVTHSLEVKPR